MQCPCSAARWMMALRCTASGIAPPSASERVHRLIRSDSLALLHTAADSGRFHTDCNENPNTPTLHEQHTAGDDKTKEKSIIDTQ